MLGKGKQGVHATVILEMQLREAINAFKIPKDLCT